MSLIVTPLAAFIHSDTLAARLVRTFALTLVGYCAQAWIASGDVSASGLVDSVRANVDAAAGAGVLAALALTPILGLRQRARA